MKNHWLNKKEEKIVEIEIDLSLCEDIDFTALNAEITKELDKELIADLKHNDRYKEYDRGVDPACEEHDRTVVTEILLKYKDRSHWIDEVLTDVGYVPTPDSLTINSSIISGDNITLSKGFPQDDEKSMVAGCCGNFACNCSANLDIWYPDNKFIQNETLEVINDRIEGRDITQYQTMFTPVLPGTMTGTVYCNAGKGYGFVFNVSAEGKFDFTKFITNDDGVVAYHENLTELTDEQLLEKLANGEYDNRFMSWYDEVYANETNFNWQTGVLELHYRMGIAPIVVVSYEYNREC